MQRTPVTTYIVVGAVLLTVLYALHVLQNNQVPPPPPLNNNNHPTRQAALERPVPQPKDETLSVLEPLIKSVKEEVLRVEGSMTSLNNNLNQLSSRVNGLDDREATLLQRNRELADSVSSIARTLSVVDGKVEELSKREPLAPSVVVREVSSPPAKSNNDPGLQEIKRQNKEIYQKAAAIEDENYQKIKTSPQVKAHYKQHTFLHYLFEPIWNCPTKEKVPFVADDGAKYVCDTSRFARLGDDCIIYSIGVNNKAESMFDFDLATRFPNCRFFLFDPSLDRARHNELVSSLLPNMEFHDWGISPHITTFTNGKPLLPIDEIKRRLGHTGKRITSLKIDTEGAEWLTIPAFMETEEATLVDEMQIEVHFFTTDFETVIPFFESVRNKGFAIYSKDINGGCSTQCLSFPFSLSFPLIFNSTRSIH